ncbi:MAG: polysaccharide biosynthesis protein [Caldilineaceae bacterium]|nr:polysaccharide biosynthesis protein [Caldilineaceae bacterium]
MPKSPRTYLYPFAHWLLLVRNRHFLLFDLAVFATAPSLALYLRTDDLVALRAAAASLALYTGLAILIRLAVFSCYNLYRRFWRYASALEMAQLVIALFIALFFITVSFLAARLTLPWFDLPRSVPIIETLLVLCLVGGFRASVRFSEHMRMRWMVKPRHSVAKNVVIFGAGGTGAKVAHEIRNNGQLQLNLLGFIDDDPSKWGMQIHGVPVLGGRDTLASLTGQVPVDRVIIAMPTAAGTAVRAIVELCRQLAVETQIMPGLDDLLTGVVTINSLRNVQIEDLLRREPIWTDTAQVMQRLHGKRVLVTGGGGSIGSELCRQILRCQPAQLLVLGHGENSVFEIVGELQRFLADGGDPSATQITPIIADLRFAQRMQMVFTEYQPQIVFHAAAHKHVPLMEAHPLEAITNNVMGTRNLLQAAQRSQVECFVMISTDKAVNPTNVMGASKRVAELLVLQAARQGRGHYQIVRFGNVLGSRGSVIHTFKRQIAAGGPVTVTDPEMVRYFMTIPEAVQLVLQAFLLGKGGEVFMLDMGAPVKIVDLARDLIELSGYTVGRDIEICFSGLRPGEKLFEEMFTPGEAYRTTSHAKILMAANAGASVPAQLDSLIDTLVAHAEQNEVPALLQALQTLAPEYKPWTQPPAATAPSSPAQKAQPPLPVLLQPATI